MKAVLSLGKHRPHEQSRVDDDAGGNDEAHCIAPFQLWKKHQTAKPNAAVMKAVSAMMMAMVVSILFSFLVFGLFLALCDYSIAQ